MVRVTGIYRICNEMIKHGDVRIKYTNMIEERIPEEWKTAMIGILN